MKLKGGLGMATNIVFILDESGSMNPLTDDTIGGFNSFLQDQQTLKDEAYVKVVLFNDKVSTLINNQEIHHVHPLTNRDYRPSGTTALLDAIGQSISEIDTSSWEYNHTRYIFVITTDGQENSSKEYNYDEIKKMIESKKEKGWEFIFLGANIDSFSVASSLGIGAHTTSNYDANPIGTQCMFNSVSTAVKSYRESGSVDKDWKAQL
jgi:Mg-chelatase subunit ChlD